MTFGSVFKLDKQVSSVIQTSFYQLRLISRKGDPCFYYRSAALLQLHFMLVLTCHCYIACSWPRMQQWAKWAGTPVSR